MMLRSAIALLLLMTGTLQAQSPIATEDWQAQWIWLPEDGGREMLLARKVVSLPKVPAGLGCRSLRVLVINCSSMGITSAWGRRGVHPITSPMTCWM